MKILIVGSGGREHAIAASVAKSPRADKIYCAPGNAGIAEYAECVDIGAMEFEKLAEFAKEKEIDLCIVGMDDPLVGGLVDVLEDAGIRTFGPKKNAAILEGSKAFSKDLMKKYDIPTAGYENFTDPKEAIAYLENAKFPIVLKADGLALGKGVLICQNFEEAKEGVKTIMLDKKFGTAGNEMVIEEFILPDNALFLGNAFRREVRRLDKGEQDLQRSLEVVGAAEEIAGLVERGERIGVGTSLGVQVEHIAVLVLEQLVFQKMGDALRYGAVVLVRRGFELGVDRAVLCAEHGFGGAVALHFAD